MADQAAAREPAIETRSAQSPSAQSPSAQSPSAEPPPPATLLDGGEAAPGFAPKAECEEPLLLLNPLPAAEPVDPPRLEPASPGSVPADDAPVPADGAPRDGDGAAARAAADPAPALAYRLLLRVMEAQGGPLPPLRRAPRGLARRIILDAFSECLNAVRAARR